MEHAGLRFFLVVAGLAVLVAGCGEASPKGDQRADAGGDVGGGGGDAELSNEQTNSENESDDHDDEAPFDGPLLHLEWTLDFGAVALGDARALTVALASYGGDPVRIEGVGVVGEAFTLGELPALPLEIAPETSFDLEVIFTPTDNQEASGVLTIESNAFSSAVEVTLMANTSCGSLEPVGLRFEGAAVGGVYEDRFTFTNCSPSVDLEVHGIEGTAGPSQFASDFEFELPTEFPIALSPGESVDVPVVFTPQTVGDHAAHLTVRTNTRTGTSSERGAYGARAFAQGVVE